MEAPESLSDLVKGLHHVAVAVPSIAAVRDVWGRLGLTAGEVEHVPDQKVRVLVCRAGALRVELVEPAAEDSPIGSFLERRGSGLHHLAFLVDDLDEALAELARRGLRLIDEQPRPGAHGTRIAFVHPKSTGGVLIELVEEPH